MRGCRHTPTQHVLYDCACLVISDLHNCATSLVISPLTVNRRMSGHACSVPLSTLDRGCRFGDDLASTISRTRTNAHGVRIPPWHYSRGIIIAT